MARSTTLPAQSYEARPIGILGAAITHASGSGHMFLLTVFNPRTEDEKTIVLETESDRFCHVLDQWQIVRRQNKLFGYEIFESMEIKDYQAVV